MSCASKPEAKQETIEEAPEAAETVEIVIEESPEDIFIKSLEGISIAKVSSPKEVYKGRKFAEAFVFQAKAADGQPLENLSLTLSYPASKSVDEGISFEKTELITDAEGKKINAYGNCVCEALRFADGRV